MPQNGVNGRIIAQLVGAGTSVGANYCEADNAVSLCEEARELWLEAKELHLIFCQIFESSRKVVSS